jgi:hypothetical protein
MPNSLAIVVAHGLWRAASPSAVFRLALYHFLLNSSESVAPKASKPKTI